MRETQVFQGTIDRVQTESPNSSCSRMIRSQARQPRGAWIVSSCHNAGEKDPVLLIELRQHSPGAAILIKAARPLFVEDGSPIPQRLATRKPRRLYMRPNRDSPTQFASLNLLG